MAISFDLMQEPNPFEFRPVKEECALPELIPLNIDRAPLIAIEEAAESYVLDWQYLQRFPSFQAVLLRHVEPLITDPTAILQFNGPGKSDKHICYSGIPCKNVNSQGPSAAWNPTGHVVMAFATLQVEESRILVSRVEARIEHRSEKGVPADYENYSVLWRRP